MTVVTNNTFNKHIEDLKKLLTADSRLVVDVETNGLDSFSTNQICGVGVGSVVGFVGVVGVVGIDGVVGGVSVSVACSVCHTCVCTCD